MKLISVVLLCVVFLVCSEASPSQQALDNFCKCMQSDRQCFERVMQRMSSIMDIGKRMAEVTADIKTPETGGGGGGGGGTDETWGGFGPDENWDWDTRRKRSLSSENRCKAITWWSDVVQGLGSTRAQGSNMRRKRSFNLGSLGGLGGLGGFGGLLSGILGGGKVDPFKIIGEVTGGGGGDIFGKLGGNGVQREEMMSCGKVKELMGYMGYMSEEMDNLLVDAYNMNNNNRIR